MKMFPVPVSGYYSKYVPTLEVSGPLFNRHLIEAPPAALWGYIWKQRPWFTSLYADSQVQKLDTDPIKSFSSQELEKSQALR